ncbi:Uncharacterized membrane protein YfcC, ion transporter superfamily [Hathewaya proteolytica DSM 3090]|uniref:Uncharacterized membrane protein YfcC, ion transporter superfamily n=1 Tax=Hathewaya proteolytica DSM 3090 TaxID=1121331 RepID=A0A1M6QFJ7_9CLOT|nr:YfcC family protein [Hathewaya proteolytica]SHK18945.1 Uncharacterized membrane protein YfcC, ion transporter superfamily [Hathewaya proteolytica DSM 3090]
MEVKKKKLSFPTAISVLFIVLLLAAILTYVIPSGKYSTLKYNGDSKVFEMTKPDSSVEEMPATQETLDKLGIKNDVNKFIDGAISKPVGIPGTYTKVEQAPQGFKEIITAPIKGIYDSIGIILFIFILGGILGILNKTGAMNAGLASLSQVTQGKEYLLIIILTFLIALGGTTFGMAEETIALYPIMVPVFMFAGYDALVCIASIYMGSSIGTMFSTTNPFSAVIASNAAGVDFSRAMNFRIIGLVVGVIITLIYILVYARKVKNDPKKSLIYDMKDELEKKFAAKTDIPKFTIRHKLSLLLFLLSFVVMIYGIVKLEWWFEEMTALFLFSGILIGILSGLGEKGAVSNFITGAAELMGVALVVGVARGINIILDNGMISDSILNFCTSLVQGMNPSIFIIVMLIIFIVLGFFIPSSSGLAVLSIPIMAPLADAVGVSRDVVISAYLYGLGIISFITPTGLILATLSMVDVTYNKWLKFIMPLLAYSTLLAAVMLLIEVNM